MANLLNWLLRQCSWIDRICWNNYCIHVLRESGLAWVWLCVSLVMCFWLCVCVVVRESSCAWVWSHVRLVLHEAIHPAVPIHLSSNTPIKPFIREAIPFFYTDQAGMSFIFCDFQAKFSIKCHKLFKSNTFLISSCFKQGGQLKKFYRVLTRFNAVKRVFETMEVETR